MRAAGNQLEAGYPAPIPAIIASREVVIDTPLWHPSAGTALDAVLNLRIQQDVDPHIRLVAGRLPTGVSSTIPDPTPGADQASRLVVLETMMSSETAGRLGLAIGGQLILGPEPSDPLAANRGVRLAVTLVGTYDVSDPADPFWIDDSSVAHSYTYALTGFVEYLGGTLLLAPDAYPALLLATLDSRLPLIYHWRSYVAPAQVQADQLDALAQALRRARTTYPPTIRQVDANGDFGGPQGRSTATLQTDLPALISAHLARWQAGATILTILWTGAGLVILASLALVAETVARRRRTALAVVRRRGASAGQVATAILGESAILVVPAALLGALLAGVLIPVDDQGPTVIVALAGAAGAVALIAMASRRNRGADGVERARRLGGRGSGRLVAEALVVGLAVVGAVLLRGRSGAPVPAASAPGAGGPASGSSGSGPDPFLALAPALVGLAAGIIAVRLLPVVLGFVARFVARGRGLVAILGVRRAARDGSVAAVLVVALTATTVSAFASVLLDQIDAGARSAAWQAVGADYQLTGSAANLATFQAAPPAGVGPTAAISTLSVAVSTGGTRTLVAVDPAAVSAVAAGHARRARLPGGHARSTGRRTTPGDRLERRRRLGPDRPRPGVQRPDRWHPRPARRRRRARRLPAVPAGLPFVIVSSRQLSFVPVRRRPSWPGHRA